MKIQCYNINKKIAGKGEAVFKAVPLILEYPRMAARRLPKGCLNVAFYDFPIRHM